MSKEALPDTIAVIGELNVDGVATGLLQAPKLGSEIIASDFELTLGSASAIFACGVAKLGHQVAFISKTGADEFGDFCLNKLREAGISTRNILRDSGSKTGVTLSLSTRKDRALVTFLGAIASLSYEDLRMPALKGKRHLHMTSYFLQNALRPSFPRIFKEAHAAGLSTSFDPNSDPTHSWSDDIADVLAHTDVLFLNRTEALQLTRARDTRTALKSLAAQVPCAAIKLGSKGAVAVREGRTASEPGFKVEAIDTTGAGDSFAAGFISAYLKNNSLEECLRIGNACGALSTLKAGGTTSQPDTETLKRFLREHSR
jgi:sugar/nucleoside kinase (ribokinase family)